MKDKPRRSQKHEERDEDKSSAPWMGTLRHVVHDNKVEMRLNIDPAEIELVASGHQELRSQPAAEQEVS